MPHWIAGKDAPLEESVAAMTRILKDLGFDLQESAWMHQIDPVYSVRLSQRDCPAVASNGKGTTELAARASALGEMIERLACRHFFADYYLARQDAPWVYDPREQWFSASEASLEAIFPPHLREIYDPTGELEPTDLLDHNGPLGDGHICCLPFERSSDGSRQWLPVSLLGNLYASNGMAVGNSLAEARVQALCEIIERSVKYQMIGQGLSLPVIPAEVWQGFPAVKSAVEQLQQKGYGLRLLDASLGGRFPATAAVLMEQTSGRCLWSFGSHPLLEVSLERTITELLQGRPLYSAEGLRFPSWDREAVASTSNLETHFIDSSGLVHMDSLRQPADYAFTHWNGSADSHQQWQDLLTLFQEMGQDLYLIDQSHLGFPACQIIAPGFSEIYPPEELVWNNTYRAAPLRPRILRLPRLKYPEIHQLWQQWNELDPEPWRPMLEALGIAMPANQEGLLWQDMLSGDVKMLIALAVGERDEALEWLEQRLQFPCHHGRNQALLHCLHTVLMENQQDDGACPLPLEELIAPDILRQARQLAAGHLSALEELPLDNNSPHQAVLSAYQKIVDAQQANRESV